MCACVVCVLCVHVLCACVSCVHVRMLRVCVYVLCVHVVCAQMQASPGSLRERFLQLWALLADIVIQGTVDVRQLHSCKVYNKWWAGVVVHIGCGMHVYLQLHADVMYRNVQERTGCFACMCEACM